MELNLKYVATIEDRDTGEILRRIEGYSDESLQEEMGKSKWTAVPDEYERRLEREEEIRKEDLEE